MLAVARCVFWSTMYIAWADEHVHGEGCVNVCKEPSETRRRKQGEVNED